MFDFEVGPPVSEALDGLAFCDVECVAIGLIDLGEGLDQIDGVGFIAAQFSSDGMSINCDVHDVRIPMYRDSGRLITITRFS